ncbi:hypothetical protein G6F22_018860 [Rhizopus arrhizus]|nr:hypothetical protein G6F22_018860 [Rhizopus arrhizus]
MSAIRSSSCSSPMDTRISPSDTPAASRSAAGTPECVVDAGWQTSDSVPPRLTADLNRCSALMKRNARSRPPSSTKANVDPGPVHWRL